MKKIAAYEVIDHGFDGAQYFQGCGVAFTEFDEVATGTGNTAKEAYDDALDSLAQNDWDTSAVRGRSKLSRRTVRGYLRSVGGLSKEDIEDNDTYAYVSVRVREAKI